MNVSKVEGSQLASQLAHDNSQKLSKSTREHEQKQLEDRGRQIRSLLRGITRRDDPTIPSDEDLEAANVIPAEGMEAVIANDLVLFKSIDRL
jgi:nucleoprotein TPR